MPTRTGSLEAHANAGRPVTIVPLGTWGSHGPPRILAGMARWSLVDPRRHLAAAVGWSMFAIVSVASLLAAELAARASEQRAQADSQRLVAQFAAQVRQSLSGAIHTRVSIVLATGAQIVVSDDRGTVALRRHLEAVQAQFPEFAWLGVVDPAGRVVAGTGGIGVGESVAGEPWFQTASLGPVVTDAPERRAPGAGASTTGGSEGIVNAAAPIRYAGGQVTGLIAAQLRWSWMEGLRDDLLAALNSPRHPEMLLLNGSGRVLLGPAPWLGRVLPEADVTEGGRWIAASAGSALDRDALLAWRVVIRIPADEALGPARDTRRTVFLVVLASGLMAALCAVAITRLLLRPLTDLARQAVDVRDGRQTRLAALPGADEVGRIAATLAELVGHLQQEKSALAELNAQLDARVAERSARIERLADESRHAAVTRERLRMARDLHDTLAHSLMALLTQMRLMRKLRPTLSAEALDEELERSEAVAADGLARARATITQMRHNGVRDVGLGAALHKLLERLGERSGITTELRSEPQIAAMAGERAEAVFRIVEEALRNVERHAGARTIAVELASYRGDAAGSGDRCSVCVTDDGAGFDPEAPPTGPQSGHYGLLGMREQAALIEADLRVDSAPGAGTRVQLVFDA